MSIGMFLLAIAPVIVIFVVLVLFRQPADITGLIGWVFTALLAWLLFHTGLSVILRASLSGIVASLPVSLVVATSIFQMTLMQKTGALDRLIVLLKTVSRGNQIVQILIINVGVGTVLTALGAVPVSILPPIMLALGYSAFAAIALPAIGYDSLCTYALLGTPVVIFAQFTNQPVEAVGRYFARFMPVVTTLIALGMLWIVGKWRMVAKGLVPTIITGLTAGFIAIWMNHIGLVTLTGIAAGIGVVIIMTIYLLILRQPILDRSALLPEDLKIEQGMSLVRALSPWIILIVLCLLANEPWIGIKKFLFDRIAMPWRIIPGQPEKLRVFWQAYWWILVSSFLALPFLKKKRIQGIEDSGNQGAGGTQGVKESRNQGANGNQVIPSNPGILESSSPRPSPGVLKSVFSVWWKRAPRPVFSAAIFFAIAYIINHSGKPGLMGPDGRWLLPDPGFNMVALVANTSAHMFGKFYAFVSPYIGLLAGFISGSESSAIAMLTKLHMDTAARIGSSGYVIAAASAIGGGLASVISPAKLQNASAAIDRIGLETEVIKTAVVIAVVIVLAVSILALIWA